MVCRFESLRLFSKKIRNMLITWRHRFITTATSMSTKVTFFGKFIQYVEGHRQKASSIYKHSKEHNTAIPNNFSARFSVIKKCTNKFDCLVNEMLCIQDLKPTLNVQSDSLRAKVFM